MKNLVASLVILATLMTAISCVKEVNVTGIDTTNSSVVKEQFINTKSIAVKAPADKNNVTRVVLHRANGDTEILATTDVDMNVDVQLYANTLDATLSSTRAESDDYIEIIELTKRDAMYDGTPIVSGSKLLCFEDTKSGDFDYNDLVLYVKHEVSGKQGAGKLRLWIKPLALGSTSTITFGWEDDNGEHIMTTDVRRDFFFGKSGFVNTQSEVAYDEVIPVVTGGGNDVYDSYTVVKDYTTMENYKPDNAKWRIVCGYFKYEPVATSGYAGDAIAKSIKFFIKSNGYKFYIAGVGSDAPADTFPYGVALYGGGYYPREKVHIWEAYPDFEAWIKNGKPTSWEKNTVKESLYTNQNDRYRW